MPQIGWFEILIVVVVAILIIGPKDFPIVIRKIGKWTGSIKRYFNEIQNDVTDLQDTIEEEIVYKLVMGNIGWSGIIIVAVLVILLFGRGKISSIMGDVAKGIKSFKRGMSDESKDTTANDQTENKSNEDNNLENK